MDNIFSKLVILFSFNLILSSGNVFAQERIAVEPKVGEAVFLRTEAADFAQGLSSATP